MGIKLKEYEKINDCVIADIVFQHWKFFYER